MAFQLSISTRSPAQSGFFAWESEDTDKLSVRIDAVDAYPLFSRFGSIAGAPHAGRVLHKTANGTIYHSSDGFVFSGYDLPGGWQGAAYPEPWNENFKDRFFWVRFGNGGKMDGILECHRPSNRAICSAYFKQEPVFIQARFSWTQIENLSAIEERSRTFINCIASADRHRSSSN